MRLTTFKALTFDCYGTLIDWESGMIAGLRPLTDRIPGGGLSRNKILQAHALAESTQQAQTPTMRYRDLLAVVCKRLAEQWGVAASHEDCAAYGRSVKDWPAFPDSAEALAYLKRHYKLVILSNVDNESFAASAARLGVAFDAVLTAEDIGSYKPNPRNFATLLDVLERGIGGTPIRKAEILHTAESLFHDHRPANGFGLASCWIHRRHAEQGFGATMDTGDTPRIDVEFHSMADLVAAHRREIEEGAAQEASPLSETESP